MGSAIVGGARRFPSKDIGDLLGECLLMGTPSLWRNTSQLQNFSVEKLPYPRLCNRKGMCIDVKKSPTNTCSWAFGFHVAIISHCLLWLQSQEFFQSSR